MKRKYNINNKFLKYFVLAFCFYSCAAPDFYTIEDVEKEKVKMRKGKNKSAQNLLEIYQDFKQPYDVRLAALRALRGSDLPFVLESMRKSIASAELIEFDLVNQSVNMLLEYKDRESTEALIECLKSTETKIMDLRENIVSAIGTNGSEDEIITLVSLYEISKTNHFRMNKILAETLGKINDDKIIPILMEIASDEDLSVNVRGQAIEILGRKNSIELVDYFIKVLDDPSANNDLNKFAHMMFEEFEDPRMMMSIVESYQLGKSEYYRLLNSLINGMSNYQSSDIKDALLEISKTKDNPHHIRIKAINALAKVADENIVNEMLLMLEDNSNYKYYNEIIQLIENMNMDNDSIKNNLRKAAFKAMENHMGNLK